MRNIITAITLAATAASVNAYTTAEIDRAAELSILSVKCSERGFAPGAGVLGVAIALSKGRGGIDGALKAAKAIADFDAGKIEIWDRVYETMMDNTFQMEGEDGLAFMCGPYLRVETSKFMKRRK